MLSTLELTRIAKFKQVEQEASNLYHAIKSALSYRTSDNAAMLHKLLEDTQAIWNRIERYNHSRF